MNELRPFKSLIISIWDHLSFRKHVQLSALLLLMAISAALEILNIGAALPFLSILTAPAGASSQSYIHKLTSSLHISKSIHLVVIAALFFAMIVIITNAIRLLVIYALNRLTYSIGAEFSIAAYRYTLYQPYFVHLSRNSSESISGIAKISIATNTILAVLNFLSSFSMCIAIFIAMLWVNPEVALTVFCCYGILYVAILYFVKRRILVNSRISSTNSTLAIKYIQEGLGGIRDVILDGSQEVFGENFRRADNATRKADSSNAFISSSPRFLMEALGILIILIVAAYMSLHSNDQENIVPILGALALGAQRLLPALQLSYSSWINIKGGHAALQGAVELLDQKYSESFMQHKINKPLLLNNQIEMKNVWFRYSPEGSWVIKNISFEVKKGMKVGFIGTTGGGKSTTLDILMGLLSPTRGSLCVDGQTIAGELISSWQRNIAHVPQSIYLIDATIAENIAFGVPSGDIDYFRIRNAARIAQIDLLIESWPLGYETAVGERGIRLSGGQRQRLGIARALYKNAQIIILDEATSALDGETERAVMSAIEKLGEELTILIIAHRLSTLEKCDVIFEIKDGNISQCDSFARLNLSH